jgi:putative peptidoglycan lipid II flippase
MINRVISRANRNISVGLAALLLGGSYFISALLGLVRDRLLAAQFGLGHTLDAYFAAFSIPDLLFYLLVSGALSVTFIPVLTERIVRHNRKSAWEVASSLLNLLGIATIIASILFFIFADQLMWLVAPAFDQERHDLAVSLARIIAINPFLFSISSVFASMQQAFGRFFFFAIAPVFYNLGIIFGILVLSPIYGIGGVALGVVLGAIVQMIIQRLGLIGLGFDYRRKIFWKNQGFRKVLRLILPRSVDEGIEHLIAVIERAIASGLAVGSIAAYQYAFNLKNMPITLIGTAIATAAFPKISWQAAEARSDTMRRNIRKTVEFMLWLIIPSAFLVVVLRGYLIRLLFGFGDPRTAAILGWFAGAIIFQSLLRFVARIFYAFQDTKTPLLISLAAIVLNVGLALALVQLYEVKGLAMAQSFVAGFEAVVLLVLLRKYGMNFINREFVIHIAKIAVSVLGMAAVCYALVRAFPLLAGDVGFWSLAPKFVIISVVSGLTYLGIGALVKLPEALMVTDRLKRTIFPKVTYKDFE